VQQLALIFLFGNFIFHFFVVFCPRQQKQQQQKSEKCQANKLYYITYVRNNQKTLAMKRNSRYLLCAAKQKGVQKLDQNDKRKLKYER
jgi:hypothetical protein